MDIDYEIYVAIGEGSTRASIAWDLESPIQKTNGIERICRTLQVWIESNIVNKLSDINPYLSIVSTLRRPDQIVEFFISVIVPIIVKHWREIFNY